jgi:hypothetical protein
MIEKEMKVAREELPYMQILKNLFMGNLDLILNDLDLKKFQIAILLVKKIIINWI